MMSEQSLNAYKQLSHPSASWQPTILALEAYMQGV